MIKKYLLIVAVVLLLLMSTGLIYYFIFFKNSSTNQGFNKTPKFKTSIGILRCEYENGNTKNKIYIKGNKIRTETEENKVVAYSINDGDYEYFWVNNGLDGYKVEAIKNKTGSPQPDNLPFLINGKDMSDSNICKIVLESDKIFVPPQEVKFGLRVLQ